jgi:hypothetical protein
MAKNDYKNRTIDIQDIPLYIDEFGDILNMDGIRIDVSSLSYPCILIEITDKEFLEKGYSIPGTLIRDANEDYQLLNGIVNIKESTMLLLEYPRYDCIWLDENGLLGVTLNGKTGFITKYGELVGEMTVPKYDYKEKFGAGLYKCVLNDKEGLLDANENELIPPKYDYIDEFEGGFAIVEIDEMKGLINTRGNEITPLKYIDIINYFAENGYAECEPEIGDTVFVDRHGNEHSSEEEVKMYYKVYEQVANRNRKI